MDVIVFVISFTMLLGLNHFKEQKYEISERLDKQNMTTLEERTEGRFDNDIQNSKGIRNCGKGETSNKR